MNVLLRVGCEMKSKKEEIEEEIDRCINELRKRKLGGEPIIKIVER